MLQILIALDQNGRVQYKSNTDDGIIQLGLLEVAKTVVTKNMQEQSERLIQPATLVPPSNLHG